MKKALFIPLSICALLLVQACDDDGGKAKYKAGDPCGHITAKGFCDGQTRVHCNLIGITVVEQCAGTCEFDEDNTSYCKNPCGNVTAGGSCISDSERQYCVNGELKSELCAQNNHCQPSAQGAACVPKQIKYEVDQACGQLSDKGICQDGHVFYCGSTDSKVRKESCESGCDIFDGYAACKCGSLTNAGQCIDNDTVVKFCGQSPKNYVSYMNCKDSEVCKLDTQNVANCVTKEASEPVVGQDCGTLDSDGICSKDLSKALYCHSGKVAAQSCLASTQKCYKPENGEAACRELCGSVTEVGHCALIEGEETAVYCDTTTGILEAPSCKDSTPSCGYVKAVNGFSCVATPVSGAACTANITQNGYCSAKNERIYCDQNTKIVIEACDTKTCTGGISTAAECK